MTAPAEFDPSSYTSLYREVFGYADPLSSFTLLSTAFAFAIVAWGLEHRATAKAYSRHSLVLFLLAVIASTGALVTTAYTSVGETHPLVFNPEFTSPAWAGVTYATSVAVLLAIAYTVVAAFRIREGAAHERLRRATAAEEAAAALSDAPDSAGSDTES